MFVVHLRRVAALFTLGVSLGEGCGSDAKNGEHAGSTSSHPQAADSHEKTVLPPNSEGETTSSPETDIAGPTTHSSAGLRLANPAERLLAATEDDRAWATLLTDGGSDRSYLASTLGGQSEARWENFGYLRRADGRFHQAAPLAAKVSHAGLTPTISERMPTVDAVALITIDRNNGEEPYVYNTLRSVFSVFPPETRVNVLVGDGNAAYVQPEILQEKLGAEWAARVHVWPSDPRSHDFIHERFIPQRRGGWNYARALRSYAGTQGLVLMEDDVVWAPSAVEDMARLLHASPPATTFYNFACFGQPSADAEGAHATLLHPVRLRDSKFVCTQGMYFPAAFANRLGEHIQRRIHERGWDYIMELLFQELDLTMGFTWPSLVQHTGVKSAGVTPYFHTTPCFAGDSSAGADNG